MMTAILAGAWIRTRPVPADAPRDISAVIAATRWVRTDRAHLTLFVAGIVGGIRFVLVIAWELR